MNIIILLMLISLLVLEMALFKDAISPPVFLTFVWILPFLWLSIGNIAGTVDYVMDSTGFIYMIGIVIFLMGFILTCRKYRVTKYSIAIDECHHMTVALKVIIVIEAAILAYFLVDVLAFAIKNMRGSLWYTYKWGMNNSLYKEKWFISYGRNASRAITIVMYAFVNTSEGNAEKKERRWMWIQVIIAAIFHIIGPGRNDIFALLIPIGIIYVITHRKSGFDSFSKIVKLGLVLVAIFYIYYVFKNPNRDSNLGVISSIENYLCGGTVSFVDWVNQGNHQYGHGLYTFRFFCAIARDLFGSSVEVVSPVEKHVLNFNNHYGNVYTMYKWYANDFGLWYAFLWQFIFGCIHGKITRRFQDRRDTVSLIVFAFSFFPLFMQFFQDEYISIVSTWIQMYLWIFLCANTELLYKRDSRSSTISES